MSLGVSTINGTIPEESFLDDAGDEGGNST